VTVLHRIDVHVIDVLCKVTLTADLVLPEAALPDAAFTLVQPGATNGFAMFNRAGKAGLDQ